MAFYSPSYDGDVVLESSLVFGEPVTGSGTAFTLANTPRTGTLRLYRGGSRQTQGQDYSLSGPNITFFTAVADGEVIVADYDT